MAKNPKNASQPYKIHTTTLSSSSSASSANTSHHSIGQTTHAMHTNTAVVTGYALKWNAYAMALTIVRMHPTSLNKLVMPLTMALTIELLVTFNRPPLHHYIGFSPLFYIFSIVFYPFRSFLTTFDRFLPVLSNLSILTIFDPFDQFLPFVFTNF